MTLQISRPEVYLIGRASLAAGRHLSLDLLRAVLDSVYDDSAVEILDEESADAGGGMASFIVKISEPLPASELSRLSELARSASGNGVEYSFLPAVADPNQVIALDDVSTEYFRRKIAVESQFITNGETRVRLTHRPTGITARCTTHRRKSWNFEEALFVLASLVAISR